MEAPARPLGEVAALDEHGVEAAQRGVPRDAGAGGAAADHEDVGLQLGTSECYCPGSPAGVRIRFERAVWWRPSITRTAPERERIDSDCVSTRRGP